MYSNYFHTSSNLEPVLYMCHNNGLEHIPQAACNKLQMQVACNELQMQVACSVGKMLMYSLGQLNHIHS